MINKFQTGGQVGQFEADMAQIFSQATKSQVQPEQIAQLAQIDPQSYQQARQTYQQGNVQGAAEILMQMLQSMQQQQTQAMRKGAKLNYLKRINNTCPEGTQLTYYKVGGQICSKCEAMAKQKTVNVMDSIKAEMFSGGGKARKQINPNDTIHTKFGIRDLTPDGRTGYKRLTKDEYHKLGYDQSRVDIKEERSGRADLNVNNKAPQTEIKKPKKKENGGNITSKACPKCGKVHSGKCGSKLMKKKKKCACGAKLDAKKCGGKTVSKKKPMDKCGAKLKEMKCGSKMKKAKKHELGGILEAMQKFAKGGSLNGVPFRN